MYNHKDGCKLRKVTKEDLPILLELKNESWWGTHRSTIANKEDQEKWFNEMPENSLIMIAEIENPEGLEPLGVAIYSNIDLQNSSLNISGSIFKKCRIPEKVKAGFAAGLDFAFEMFNVNRIEAEVISYNIPAQNIEIDYLGFVVEGKKRQSVFKCGKYYDSIILSMLRQEWVCHPRVVALGDTCNNNFSHDKMMRIQERFGKFNMTTCRY